MTPAWAQRREALLSDCLVSPDVFHQMVDRLGEFAMPYQQALETEADPHSMHLYLQGLLSHVPHKNAEEIAAWVDVERQVLQDFIADFRRLKFTHNGAQVLDGVPGTRKLQCEVFSLLPLGIAESHYTRLPGSSARPLEAMMR